VGLGTDAPDLRVASDLPIGAHAGAIAELIAHHQVVIVAGETGSGKTTQLPKICLALGRGAIAHTQPRRIAARSVSARIATELGVPLGGLVGYQVRFTREATAETRLTLMTDGILLAQIGRDRDLRRYDTIVIDEAHERSLTIDFLLGYLKQLLPRRKDLKVVITSATIDTARFSAHFDGAPVVEVSGRGYPVEVRYRPLGPDGDQVDGIVAGVRELRELGHGRGDILVFCAGEREIRDATDALSALRLTDLEVLPLFARLSTAEQQRVFAPHAGQRVVLATNVAETSLTVPGVRYVIDPGFARVSRYSARTKVQRLPIEPISRASADQRAGRCGRVAPGVALRLYTEEDYLARPAFTEPEILRTNLASVILRMADAHLGDIATFPFVEAPEVAQIADGYRLLVELGAITPPDRRGDQARARLTPRGRQLARLPVDPRLGRILLEAADRGCLREALVLVAGFSIQDIRERPLASRAQADALHARFASDEALAAALGEATPKRQAPARRDAVDGGDVAAMLRLWDYLRRRRRELTGNQFRRTCHAEYLNYLRVREWQDLTAQLRDVCAELKLRPASGEAPMPDVLMSVLSGYLSHVGLLEVAPSRPPTGARRTRAPREYLGARGARFVISPASVLARHPPPLVMAIDLVETTRLWAHAAASVDAAWVEEVGAHLLKRSYAQPHFSSDTGTVVAYEKVSLLGVPLVVDRLAGFADIDPVQSRALFIRQGLVERGWTPGVGSAWRDTLEHNWWLWGQLENLEERTRRRDLLIGDDDLYAFYDARLPEGIVSVAAMETWAREAPSATRSLMAREDDLTSRDATFRLDQFPDTWHIGGLDLPVAYVFAPGAERDGVTVTVRLAQLGGLPPEPFTWQVPGLRADTATELLRHLPKAVRTRFVPATDAARRALAWLGDHDADQTRPFTAELGRALTALTGETVEASAWAPQDIPAPLQVGFVVTDGDRTLAYGKDLAALKKALAPRVEARLTRVATKRHRRTRSGTSWVFGDLPARIDLGGGVAGYPALRDAATCVTEVVCDTAERQHLEHPRGVLRLLALTLPDPSPYAVAYLSNEDRLSLVTSAYPDSRALWADARLKAIARLMAESGDAATVRTEAAFEALSVAVRRGLAERLRAVVVTTAATLRAARAVQALLDTAPSGPAAEDVAAQVDDLVFPGFIGFTRDPWFGYLPRYLEAAAHRLREAGIDPGRDARRRDELAPLLDEYAALLDAAPPGPSRPEIEDVAFLLEELRIQVFAQTLGTHVTVSPKRIRRAIAEVRAGLAAG